MQFVITEIERPALMKRVSTVGSVYGPMLTELKRARDNGGKSIHVASGSKPPQKMAVAIRGGLISYVRRVEPELASKISVNVQEHGVAVTLRD